MNARVVKEAPDPIDMHVGKRVRGRRVGLGISQTKLGQAIGVTFQQIQKYENGANRIGSSNLYKVAKALDVEVSYFFEGLEDAPRGLSESRQNRFEEDPLRSREAIELMHNYYRIGDPQVRKRLFQFVKALSGAVGEAE